MNDTYPKRCSTSVRKTQIEIVMRPYVHLMEKKKKAFKFMSLPCVKTFTHTRHLPDGPHTHLSTFLLCFLSSDLPFSITLVDLEIGERRY